MTGQVLEKVMDTKYLEVTLSNDLEWSKHTAIMTNKANSKLSFLRRNLKGCREKLKQTACFSRYVVMWLEVMFSLNRNCLQLFCTDAYGCQLWNFESRDVHNLYVAWRKVVRKLWRLPYISECNLLHTINNSLPIHRSLEKRGIKSIWSCLNSENCVVKKLFLSLQQNCHVLFWS